MAFHVACPITCRRICFCPLGFPKGLVIGKRGGVESFVDDVARIGECLRDCALIGGRDGGATVQVLVPKMAPPPLPPPPITIHLPPLPLRNSKIVDGDLDGRGERVEEGVGASSAQSKRSALQKKAEAAKVAAEDYARKFEAGENAVSMKEEGQANANVVCRICFHGDKEGSERAKKLLSCKLCGKKYHKSCVKTWGQHRDLFHWSSWTCPSCRLCEICKKVGDPSKFMFCRRCDGAFHCYCQHPPHKNVSTGPYLCPKHTKCHSCGSYVPGNGLSVRWFLGYTCCDACGRLFVKGNYCPVCLKVYRDSESTPMVCCDTCQRWVHCHCDNISDQKYLQFQVDNNLQYKCATCRGECYQVKGLDDAVQELWRRRDEADQALIASIRAAAGLPSQKEISLLSPPSEDEDNPPGPSKSDATRSIKLSLKGYAENTPKKSKESSKKSSKKKSSKKKVLEELKEESDQNDAEANGRTISVNFTKKKEERKGYSSNVNSEVEAGSASQSDGILKHKLVNDVIGNEEERPSRIIMINSNKAQETGKDSKSKVVKAKKLVINLGPRKINVNSSPRSDTSSCRRDQDLTISNGSGDVGDAKHEDAKPEDGDTDDNSNQIRPKLPRLDSTFLKFGRIKSESSNLNPKLGKVSELPPKDEPKATFGQIRSFKSSKQPPLKPPEEEIDESNDDHEDTPVVQQKDPRFSLKLKIKKPSIDNHGNNRTSIVEEEKGSSIRGQRSKRKRSSMFSEKLGFTDGKNSQFHDDEMMEASWILRKLGKDAIGKRVEVFHSSEGSWHKGVVSEISEGTSVLSVAYDDGRERSIDLGKQQVRFISHKQKRSGL